MSVPVFRAFGISRLRMASDGVGVTTLVCGHGCPLRCRYCLNPHSFAEDATRTEMTPEELYEKVKIDQLYFLASGGGVTFGGGEPLLYADFLRRFRALCGEHWHLCAETSLSVPWELVQTAAQVIDEFIIDCKDTDADIYRRYTGKDNKLMLENLARLVKMISPARIVVRLPLIPDFNDEEARQKSRKLLEAMGVARFDCFTYRKNESFDKNSR